MNIQKQFGSRKCVFHSNRESFQIILISLGFFLSLSDLCCTFMEGYTEWCWFDSTLVFCCSFFRELKTLNLFTLSATFAIDIFSLRSHFAPIASHFFFLHTPNIVEHTHFTLVLSLESRPKTTAKRSIRPFQKIFHIRFSRASRTWNIVRTCHRRIFTISPFGKSMLNFSWCWLFFFLFVQHERRHRVEAFSNEFFFPFSMTTRLRKTNNKVRQNNFLNSNRVYRNEGKIFIGLISHFPLNPSPHRCAVCVRIFPYASSPLLDFSAILTSLPSFRFIQNTKMNTENFSASGSYYSTHFIYCWPRFLTRKSPSTCLHSDPRDATRLYATIGTPKTSRESPQRRKYEK